MEKILVRVSIALLLFFGITCSSISIKDEQNLFPDFTVQKSFFLNQFPVDFAPIFFVKDSNGEKIYKIHKKIALVKNEFVIKVVKSNEEYILTENATNNAKITFYSIMQNNKKLFDIKKDKSKYIFSYGNIQYSIEEKINRNKAKGIRSILFIIEYQNREVGYIYKRMKFFSNQYMITINRENQKINDQFFVVIAVFLDQELTSQGYKYK